MTQRSIAARIVALLLVCSLIAPQFAAARYQPKPGFNLFSVEQEVQLGKEHAAQAEKEFPILKDDYLTRYVDKLGQRLAANAPGTKYPYTFKIVNQKEINAFALPGGPIFVNLGTIQAADNEAELAGVIGHEIGHVIMRHGTNQASKQYGFQLGAALLGGKVGGGIAGQLAQVGIGFGMGSVLLKYSRDAERQADLVGAGLLQDAGFNPKGMVTFFQKLAAESGGSRGSEFFASHPNPGNRAEAVAQEVATLPHVRYQADSSDFREVKRRAAGMKPLTAQEIQEGKGQQGQSTGPMQRSPDVMPSANLRTFEHNAYSVSHPDNWQVFGKQDADVTIAPQAGVSGNAIAYGAIISGFKPQNANSSIEEGTRELVQQLVQQNGQLQAQGAGENFKLNGRQARSVVLLGPSPIANEKERDWLVTVARGDGTLLYTVFVAPENDFKKLQPTFEKMLRSIRVK
jgi:Zn-dependent protease with chaperone function